MVSTQNYLCPDMPLNSTDSNPLQQLMQTCNSVGLPEPPAKTKNGGSCEKGLSTEKGNAGKSNDPSSSTKASKSSLDTACNGTTSESKKSTKSHHGASRQTERPGSGGASKTVEQHSPSKFGGSSRGHETTTTRCSSTPKDTISGAATTAKPTISQTLPPTLPAASLPPKYSPCMPCGAGMPFMPHLFAAGSFPYGAFNPAALGAATNPATVPMISPYAGLHTGASTNPFAAAGTLCRDPFCNKGASCPAAAAAAAARCPVGCAQCTMGSADLSWWLSLYPFLSAAGAGNLLPNVTAVSAALTSSPTSNTSGSGYQCNWSSPADGACGKRFTNSEELMQHLRSHAGAGEDSSRRSPSSSSSMTITTNAVHLPTPSAAHLGLSGGRVSPRTYHSSLAALSNRFHPYASATAAMTGKPNLTNPLAHLSPFGGFPGVGHPALTALYGQHLPGSLSHS